MLEDDETFSWMLESELVDAGYEVTICRVGSEALFHLMSKEFDLLIADMHVKTDRQIVPDGGLQLIGRLRQSASLELAGNNAKLPIIAISGSVSLPGQRHLLDTAKSIGATDVLAKPFSAESLTTMVAELLKL